MNIFKKLLGIKPKQKKATVKGIQVEKDRIHFHSPYMYTDKQQPIHEIFFSEIKQIRVESYDVDVAYTEHSIIIEVFGDTYIKDFLIYDKYDKRFAKDLFTALKIDFNTKHFSTRREIEKVVYKRVK